MAGRALSAVEDGGHGLSGRTPVSCANELCPRLMPGVLSLASAGPHFFSSSGYFLRFQIASLFWSLNSISALVPCPARSWKCLMEKQF